MVPVPSWPFALLPQQRTLPDVRSAQVWLPPAEIDTMPVSAVPAALSTVTGAFRWVAVPSPRRELVLRPQHRAVPLESRAHVCDVPALTCVAVVIPLTAVEAKLSEVVVPVPSWPLALLPQQRTPPEVSTAQVWVPPAETDTTPVSGVPAALSTFAGVARCVVEPSPSRPLAFEPQHMAVPSVSRAQVCTVPAVTTVGAALAASTLVFELDPPAVVTRIGPDATPVAGIVTRMLVADSTVIGASETPFNVAVVTPPRFVPVTVRVVDVPVRMIGSL